MRDLLRRAIELWAICGGLLLLIIVGATAANVGTYLLDVLLTPLGGNVPPLGGYEDIVTLLIGAAVAMLLPYCQLQRGHVSVDFFVERMPSGAKGFADRLSALLMVATALFLLYWTARGAVDSYHDNVSSLVLGWPEWLFYVPVVISLALWTLAALLTLREPPHVPGTEVDGAV